MRILAAVISTVNGENPKVYGIYADWQTAFSVKAELERLAAESENWDVEYRVEYGRENNPLAGVV